MYVSEFSRLILESNSLKSLLYVMELEWISAASSLVNVLRRVPDVRYSAISGIFRSEYWRKYSRMDQVKFVEDSL